MVLSSRMTKCSFHFDAGIGNNGKQFWGKSCVCGGTVLDDIHFSKNHVQTNASFISAGWVSAGFIAERFAREGSKGEIAFDDACMHLIAVNYLLHNMGFFTISRNGAFDLKISLETLLSAWKTHCQSWNDVPPPAYVSPDHYFRIPEATALLGTYWCMNQPGSDEPMYGLVRGMNLIYPSLWMLSIHWLDRADPVHFDRLDFSALEIAAAGFKLDHPHHPIFLPYTPGLPLSSDSAPING